MSEQFDNAFLEDDSIVTLTDEEGNDIDFIILDTVELNGADYLILFPLEVEEDKIDDESVLILHATRTDDGEIYESVEDESILNAVYDRFVAQNPVEDDEDEE